jgi:nucleoside-diphosphate-sugar epimerase
MERVFITGATGCVGRYVAEALAETGAYEVHALVRPGSPYAQALRRSGAVVHEGTLERVRDHAETIGACHVLLHMAAAWDDSPRAFDVNVHQTMALVDSCDPAQCRRIIAFSTASILGSDHALLDAARDHGTAYVRSKYEAYRRLQACGLRDRIVVVCPTLIFGGDAERRRSHVTRELAHAGRYLRVARYFSAAGAFHFIHARDLSTLVCAAIAPASALGTIVAGPIVAGQAAVTIEAALEALCAVKGVRYRGWLPLTPGMVLSICRLMGVTLSAWDRHCIAHRAFVYRVTRPEDLGQASAFPTFADVIRSSNQPP